MDKEENKNITQSDLPISTEKNEVVKTPVQSNQDSSKAEDVPLTNTMIANSEKAETTSPVQGQSVLDNQADFQSIFNVVSEESPSEKKEVVKAIDKEAAPVVSTKKEPPKPLPEDKDLTEEEKIKKAQIRQENYNGTEKVIYEFQEEKEGNPIVVVIFFATLISLILILPYITKKAIFENKQNGIPVTSGEQQQTSEDTYYNYNVSSIRAKIGNLELTNFVKHNKNDGTYTLTINVTNKQDSAYTFDKKYYILFYKDENQISRGLLYYNEVIGSNSTTNIEIPISQKAYNESNRFRIIEILTSSYPSVSITATEGEYRILTCIYNKDEMNYYFLDNQLAKIKETYHDINDLTDKVYGTPEYNSELNRFNAATEKYGALSTKYKKIDNFSSNFINSSHEFTMINEFDFKDIPDTVINNLNEYKFFRYNESKDIVNFEMESLGYNCN